MAAPWPPCSPAPGTSPPAAGCASRGAPPPGGRVGGQVPSACGEATAAQHPRGARCQLSHEPPSRHPHLVDGGPDGAGVQNCLQLAGAEVGDPDGPVVGGRSKWRHGSGRGRWRRAAAGQQHQQRRYRHTRLPFSSVPMPPPRPAHRTRPMCTSRSMAAQVACRRGGRWARCVEWGLQEPPLLGTTRSTPARQLGSSAAAATIPLTAAAPPPHLQGRVQGGPPGLPGQRGVGPVHQVQVQVGQPQRRQRLPAQRVEDGRWSKDGRCGDGMGATAA